MGSGPTRAKARLLSSVEPEVNTASDGAIPTAEATCPRARSIAALCPVARTLAGLPNSADIIAPGTHGSIGVVAL